MSAHRLARRAAAAAATAALLALPGCTATISGSGTALPPGAAAPAEGSSTPAGSPAELARRAHDQLANAASVHVSGDNTVNGVRLRFEITTSPDGAEGDVATMGADIQIKLVESALYLRAPASFWRQHAGLSAAQSAYLASKWLQTRPTADFAPLQGFATPASLAEQLFSDVDLDTLAFADSRTIGGRPAIGLADPSDGSVLYVATTGDPVPLAVVAGPAVGARGQLLFTEYGAPTQITAPAPDETLVEPDAVAHI